MTSRLNLFRFLFCAPLLLSAEIDPQAYLKHVQYLASPELKGRATGSPELEKAAGYIAGQFKSFGLKPIPNATYELPFPVTINAHLGTNNHFQYRDGGSTACTGIGCPTYRQAYLWLEPSSEWCEIRRGQT